MTKPTDEQRERARKFATTLRRRFYLPRGLFPDTRQQEEECIVQALADEYERGRLDEYDETQAAIQVERSRCARIAEALADSFMASTARMDETTAQTGGLTAPAL